MARPPIPPDMHLWDPTRRRIIDRQRADGRRASWRLSPDELRQMLVSATAEVGTPAQYAHRLNCTPGFLWEVLTGERRASGPMLEALGLVWDGRKRAYTDPLLSRRARHIQDDRLRRSVPPAQRAEFEADPAVRQSRERAAARAKAEAQADLFPSGLPEMPAREVETRWIAQLARRDPTRPAPPWPTAPVTVGGMRTVIPFPKRRRDDDLDETLGRT